MLDKFRHDLADIVFATKSLFYLDGLKSVEGNPVVLQQAKCLLKGNAKWENVKKKFFAPKARAVDIDRVLKSSLAAAWNMANAKGQEQADAEVWPTQSSLQARSPSLLVNNRRCEHLLRRRLL